jgi:NADH-quinone oxidoreductase subunit L
LDLRKISGLRHMKGWRITAWTMLIGCLALAGFPLTSGFFSKDAILAEAFVTQGPGFEILGWMAIFTAGLTAYYTFRVWFRVCAGPASFEPGDEKHDDHGGEFHPHAPRFAINMVLVILAVGSLVAAVPYFMSNQADDRLVGGWVADMVHDSPARGGLPGFSDTHAVHAVADSHEAAAHVGEAPHPTLFGMDPHAAMYWISGTVGIVGLLLAAWLHLWRRSAADAIKAWLYSQFWIAWLPRAMERKWYVDEFYHVVIRAPLWILGHICYAFDRFIIDGLCVDGIARIPRGVARWLQPLQAGAVQSLAVVMAGGAAIILLLMALFMQFGWFGGQV